MTIQGPSAVSPLHALLDVVANPKLELHCATFAFGLSSTLDLEHGSDAGLHQQVSASVGVPSAPRIFVRLPGRPVLGPSL